MSKGLLRSFAGGEITPEMFGRLDLTKYQTGVALAENFRTVAHGPLTRRPGLYFVNEGRDSTNPVWLIPFIFSATQAVLLELSHLTMRFHTSAGTVLEAAQAATTSVNTINATAHGYANGDGVYLAGTANWPAALAGRFAKVAGAAANSFSLTDLAGNALTFAAGGTGTVARVYTLTTTFPAASLAGLRYAQNADVLTITQSNGVARELRRTGATNWTLTDINFAPTATVPTGVTATPTIPHPADATVQSYVVTSVLSDLVTESTQSAVVNATNNLAVAGNFNVIAWATTGAARYYVYKLQSGVYGYIGQTTSLSFTDNNIQPDTLTTPPSSTVDLNTGTTVNGLSDYPVAVAYHERRRWFAGTPYKPQNIWATRNATESNLTSSIPARPDDSLEFRIASNQQHAIRHLIPLVDLVALTVGGEFRIYADGAAAITPDSLAVRQQGSNGISDVAPVLAVESAFFVQHQGSFVRELSYDPTGLGRLNSTDVSVMAPHLFTDYTIVQMAYVRAPDPTLWCVRSDGVLLGLTYVPEQQVYGWHHHTTAGAFESIAVIPENNADQLYAVVRRTIGGRTVRTIERMAPRTFPTQSDAFYVDAGLTYSGAAVTTISGLWHLEGQAVVALADGAVVLGLTVVGGSVTLPVAAKKVQVGLSYTSRMQTLPAAYDQAPAMGQGTQKNVSKVFVRVKDSMLVQAGPSFSQLRAYPARDVSQHYDTPPALRTGELAFSIDPSWNTDGAVCIAQDGPTPLTIVALTLDWAVGG
jgi:hypothetical protein